MGGLANQNLKGKEVAKLDRSGIDISNLKKDFFREIESCGQLKNLDSEKINDFADKLASLVRKDIATSQLRKVYSEIKRIQRSAIKSRSLDRKALSLLTPRLAYAAARKPELRHVYELFEKCKPKILDEGDLNNFVYVLEALVAYHKYYGDRGASR